MKMFRIVLITAFLSMVQTGLAQEKSAGKATLVVRTPATCNHCKICETCGQLLETDLYFVSGIKLVEYNEDTQTTTVVYKPKKITPDEIRREIAKLGFDADDVKADPAGYEKRDTCCK